MPAFYGTMAGILTAHHLYTGDIIALVIGGALGGIALHLVWNGWIAPALNR